MLTKDIMTKYVLTCGPETTVHQLIRLFVKHGVNSIPVVGEDNRLMGIISEGDLLYKKVRPHVPRYVNVLGASLYYSGYGKYEDTFQKLLATTAKEIMTGHVIYVAPESEADVVADLMVEEHLKNVPVVQNERLVGIVDRSDILRLIAKENDLPADKE